MSKKNKIKNLEAENERLLEIVDVLSWFLAHSDKVEHVRCELDVPRVCIRHEDGQRIIWEN